MPWRASSLDQPQLKYIHMFKINELHMARKELDNLKNIFCFPLPNTVLQALVGLLENYFFLISQIRYPLNLIVNSPAIGNNVNTVKPV